jgi:hypothetical protein
VISKVPRAAELAARTFRCADLLLDILTRELNEGCGPLGKRQ